MLPYYNCQEHPAQQYTNLCIHSHKCNIKLCSDCVYNHKGKKEKMLPEAVFKQKILKVIHEHEKKYPQNFYDQQREKITKYFQEIENQLQQTIQKLKQQTENLINIFEEETKYLNKLKSELENKSIFDFSNKKLYRMGQLINLNQLPINQGKRADIFSITSSVQNDTKFIVQESIGKILESSKYIRLTVGEDKIIENSNFYRWLWSLKSTKQKLGLMYGFFVLLFYGVVFVVMNIRSLRYKFQ